MIRAFLALVIVDGLRLFRNRIHLSMVVAVPLLIVAGSVVLTQIVALPKADLAAPTQASQSARPTSEPIRIAVPDDLRERIDASKRFVVTDTTKDGFVTPPEGADFALSQQEHVLTLTARDAGLGSKRRQQVEKLVERAIQQSYRRDWRHRGPTHYNELVQWNVDAPDTTPNEAPSPNAPYWILVFAITVILMSQSLASTLFTQTRVERTRDTLSMAPLIEYFTLLSKFFWVLAPSLTAGFLTAALYTYPPLGLVPPGERLPPMYGAIPLGVTLCFCMMALHARATSLRSSAAMSIVAMLPLLFLILPGVMQAELPTPLWMFPFTSATHLAHSVHLGSPPVAHLHPLLVSWMWIAMLVLSTRLAWRHQPNATDEKSWELFAKASVGILLAAWLIGQPMLMLSSIAGLAFNELILLALLACWIPWWAGQPWRETMGFRWPDKRTLFLAVLIGMASPALTVWVHEMQQAVSLTPNVHPIGARWEQLSPMGAILLLAVLPGICEEWMFRGSLLGLLRFERIGETPAVLSTAVVFGVLHFDPARMLPTAVLGVCLGVLAFRSQCVWVAVLAHILHNTMLLLGFSTWLIDTGLTIPIACSALGLTWLTRSTR